MSLDGRLTALQNKVDQLLELVKVDKTLENVDKEGDVEQGLNTPVKSAQAEIRTLELWKCVVAECLGTLTFVFIVCGVSIPWTGHFPPFLSVALASALAYGALTYKVFPGSHLNPAFSLALTAIKIISPLRCLLFLTAQAGGGIAGAAILFGLTTAGYQGTLGATVLATHLNPIQGLGLEFILTFILTLTYITDTKNCVPTTAILLACNLVALPCTGAGLNPVRSLGPAFVMNKWPSHWIFWLGPIAGALLAAYFYKFILRRARKVKKDSKVRENPGDGDSLDLQTDLHAHNVPHNDRILCTERNYEGIYGGTRSLYMRPSPVLPRISRSQSVYASKRLDYTSLGRSHKDLRQPKFESSRKQQISMTPHSHTGNSNHHYQPESNYESLYERKCTGASAAHTPHSFLLSGPPSYESGYCKVPTSDISKNNVHNHHHRDKSDLSREILSQRENHTNRILAQYEIAKGLVDVDPKAAMKKLSSPFYETRNDNGNNTQELIEKKLIESSSECSSGSNNSSGSSNPPPPPRFRIASQQNNPPSSSSKFQSSGQCASELINDLSRGSSKASSITGESAISVPPHSVAKKPYELLAGVGDPNCRRLMDFSPNHQHQLQQHLHNHHHQTHHLRQHSHSSQATSNSNNTSVTTSGDSANYSPRLLMAEKDSTYSRILEPLLNSKPNGYCRPSPNDHLTFSYH